jgi:hypothetical protein
MCCILHGKAQEAFSTLPLSRPDSRVVQHDGLQHVFGDCCRLGLCSDKGAGCARASIYVLCIMYVASTLHVHRQHEAADWQLWRARLMQASLIGTWWSVALSSQLPKWFVPSHLGLYVKMDYKHAPSNTHIHTHMVTLNTSDFSHRLAQRPVAAQARLSAFWLIHLTPHGNGANKHARLTTNTLQVP